MTTVGELVDRTFRQYLEPPDAQPASTRLAVSVDDTETSFQFEIFDVPEDENLVRIGSIVEVDSELCRMANYDVVSHLATVIRNQLGSKAASHTAGATVKLSPPFARMDVFNSVSENITMLYPKLWSVRTAIVTNVGIDVYPVPDDLAVEVIEASLDQTAKTMAVEARIVDYHRLTGGRAVVTHGGWAGPLWLRYRRRFGVAVAETNILADLGVDDSWQQVVTAGVAADLLAGRDIPASFVEWIGSTLQAENIRVGTRAQLSVGLVRYRELLADRMGKEMKTEDSSKPRVRMNDPFAVV